MKFAPAALFPLLPVATVASDAPGMRGVGQSNRGLTGGTVKAGKDDYFNRIAVFHACSQIDPTCDTDTETVAEILDVTDDGHTIVYADSKMGAVGFVDITDPFRPVGLGYVEVNGETTSVAVKSGYVLAAVNTSPDLKNPSGYLKVIDIASHSIECTLDLGGQPDAVGVSPDKHWAAVAIENERDEDRIIDGVEGGLPQQPAGFLIVVDISADDCNDWETKKVHLKNLNGLDYKNDPEPEFVSINEDNMCIVTLQENNALAIVDLEKARVKKSWSAGKVDLKNVDTVEDGVIDQSDQLKNVPREPDGAVWLDTRYFATADEGDLDGGSRGFTIWDADRKKTVYESGNDLEHLAAKIGHYPEERSENKGNEPEMVVFGKYGKHNLLFVLSERSSVIFVYNVNNPKSPRFIQVLPSGVGPESGKAIPQRGLFVVASEVDARDDKIRSVVNIYHINGYNEPDYPTIYSQNRGHQNFPIPFSAMSGLAAKGSSTLYAVEDSFYNSNRIFTIDISNFPAVVKDEIFLLDSHNKLKNVHAKNNDNNPNKFSKKDRNALVNNDDTINIDPEGIAISTKYGGFWVVSEGSGTIDDPDRPIESLNFLLKVDNTGAIDRVYTLPNKINDGQLRFGFEGVAEDGKYVVVAFQRAWTLLGDENPRLGIFNSKHEKWDFVFYPLDLPESQNGGWVGLSDIAPLGDMKFLVLERDNQGGPDAAIKRLYEIDLSNYMDGQTIQKKLIRDLIPDLLAPHGQIYEKVEGLAVTNQGNVWVNNDNDGVDDNSGEHQLLNLGCLYSEE